MEVYTVNNAGRLWISDEDPDNSVYNPYGVYAETGDSFLNSETKKTFFCTQGGEVQVWQNVITASRSQSSASRILNTPFQLGTRDAFVSYSVGIIASLSLTGGESGYISLEIASDSNFTQNVQEISQFINQSSGTLTVGLNLTQHVSGCVSGYIPANYYVRLRTVSVTGSPDFDYICGQETLL